MFLPPEFEKSENKCQEANKIKLCLGKLLSHNKIKVQQKNGSWKNKILGLWTDT